MLSCKEASRLISHSLDGELPLAVRAGIRFHLLYCKFCSRYKDQITLIKDASRSLSLNDVEGEYSPALSPEARHRIKHSLFSA